MAFNEDIFEIKKVFKNHCAFRPQEQQRQGLATLHEMGTSWNQREGGVLFIPSLSKGDLGYLA